MDMTFIKTKTHSKGGPNTDYTNRLQAHVFAVTVNAALSRSESTILFFQQVSKPPKRPSKIAKADYISSHPSGVLGKVFNQQRSRLG